MRMVCGWWLFSALPLSVLVRRYLEPALKGTTKIGAVMVVKQGGNGFY
jgi:hypothetical protein